MYDNDKIYPTRAKSPTICLRLDFLKCVQILFSSKAQICTVCLDLLYVQFCVAVKKM